MNALQYETLTGTIQPEPQLANAKGLYNQAPRTLLFGYTGDKDTVHVYLVDGTIHKVVYNFKGHLIEHKSQAQGLLFSECAAVKRLYPEACDFEFCSVLKRRGVHLSFYNWNDKREPAAFHGKRLEELVAPATADLDIPVDAEGWNLNPLREESDMAAALLAPKLKELLLTAREAGLRTREEGIRIRDVMYVEMDVYEHLGARDAAAEWMLVSLIECALDLPAQTLTR